MTFLERVFAEKKRQVRRLKEKRPLYTFEINKEGKKKRLFFDEFSRRKKSDVRIIAEIKRASPSMGILTEDFDLRRLVDDYGRGGAKAISIITEEKYFKGSLSYLKEARGLTELPLLRKDFIVDEYEIFESKAFGADAVLLIGEGLERERIKRLLHVAKGIDIDVLLEIHAMETFEKISDLDGYILGINNRDLKTMKVDLGISERLLREIPFDMPVVVESGIETRADIERFMEYGVSGFLIGTSLMTSKNPLEKLRELMGN